MGTFESNGVSFAQQKRYSHFVEFNSRVLKSCAGGLVILSVQLYISLCLASCLKA
jgi:hypothetical protein